MELQISVIVPVYNSEEYLAKCIDSILCQTFKNIEIILVDDGSTDQSFEMCKGFKDKDPRIILIRQETSGPSAARNVALGLAKGRFLGFVDSDDWIDIDMYDVLYKNLLEYDADIAMCGYYTVYGEKDIRFRHCSPGKVVMSSVDMLKEYIDWNLIGAAVWSKLYKRELFDNIRFPPNIIGREDAFIMPMLLGGAKKGVHIGEPKYHYRIRTNSAYRRKFDKSKLEWLLVEKNLIEYVNSSFPELKDKVKFSYVLGIMDLLKDIHDSGVYEEYREVYHSLFIMLINELEKIKIDSSDNSKIREINERITKLSPS